MIPVATLASLVKAGAVADALNDTQFEKNNGKKCQALMIDYKE